MNRCALKKALLKVAAMLVWALGAIGAGIGLAELVDRGHARIATAIVIGGVLGAVIALGVAIYRIECERGESDGL